MRNSCEYNVTVVADPDLKFGQDGNPWTSVRVAWNDNVRNANGEWETKSTVYASVKAFGKLATNVAESVEKGMPLVVIATKMPLPRAYTNKEGETAVSLDIIADNVLFPLSYSAVEARREERVATAPMEVG
ncbi:MAG: single-stranded DNA-binding protein [Ferrimicrobium sp.]